MNDMIGLFTAMYKDVYGLSGAHTSEKDIMYLARRVEAEGMSFLTITLPTVADALITGLTDGRWPHSMVTGFARDHGKALPRFLSGLLRLVFDYDNGVLLSDPNIDAIYGIRQLCLTFKKVELPCTKERIDNAYQRYLDTDSEVVSLRSINKVDRQGLRKTFNTIFRGSNSRVEEEVYYRFLHPRYSGGAVAERYNENEKFSAPWYCRLNEFLPPEEFLVPSLGHLGYLDSKEFVPVGHETPARVTHVPKTLKTPRLIAIEPTCIQFAQQALMESLYRNVLATKVGRQSINFRDQSINAELALRGSKDGSIATIDLSEASDRVSAGLVSYLFKDFPHLRGALFRARSSRVNVAGAEYRLRKFASMGSATCFPIEAMVFMAIAVYGILLVDRQGFSKNVVRRACKKVTVFGDDITVPKHYAPSVMMALEYFGLKVNREKSFHKGLFRESCGTDAYAGYVVTPVYVRSLFPSSHRDAGEAVSSVSLSNQLFAGGLWRASDFVRKRVERALKVRLPVVLSTSPGLGLHIPWRSDYDQGRYNDELHRPEVRSFGVYCQDDSDELESVEVLTKSLLRLQGRRWSSGEMLPFSLASRHSFGSSAPRAYDRGGSESLLSGNLRGVQDLACESYVVGPPNSGSHTYVHEAVGVERYPLHDLGTQLERCTRGSTLSRVRGLEQYARNLRILEGHDPDLSVYTKRHVFRLKRGWYAAG